LSGEHKKREGGFSTFLFVDSFHSIKLLPSSVQRLRNKDKMRKFKKAKPHKFSKIQPVTALSVKRAIAKQLENDFVSTIFKYGDDPEPELEVQARQSKAKQSK
jgi:hypothetical protein